MSDAATLNDKCHVRLLLPEDLDSVKDIISNGLYEFADEKTFAATKEYMDQSLELDLNKISEAAIDNFPTFGERFWVAISATDRRVIGCVGIKDGATLHRMSVRKECRRMGIGRHLLDSVERYCQEAGIRTLTLRTQENLVPAVRFYQASGFQIDSSKEWKGLVLLSMSKEISESPLK